MKFVGGCSEFAGEGPKLGVKQRDRETVMMTALRSLGIPTVALTVALAIVPLWANAELSEDAHITRDDHTRLDIDRATWGQFKRFYEAGFVGVEQRRRHESEQREDERETGFHEA